MLSGMARIAIIGGGSIGEALLSGLLRAGRQVKDLVVAERMPERAKYLADTYSVLVTSVTEAVENATFVVVAVKPADVEVGDGELARGRPAENDSAEQVFVTVAAGITITYFESEAAGRDAGGPGDAERGGIGGCRGHRAGQGPFRHCAAARGGLRPVRRRRRRADRSRGADGRGDRAVRFRAGLLLLDGRGAGGRRCRGGSEPRGGHRPDRADHGGVGGDAAGTDGPRPAAGRGRGVGMRADATAAQLRATVTSPGGTTAAALRELERGGLRAAVDAAVQAAKTRSEQLRITSE